MRVLIGTLYSGENEFDASVAALEGQSYAGWSHFVISDLPEQEAHDRLYGTFMDRADDFDLFLKLDADMVLRSESTLAEIVAVFARHHATGHAIFRVDDWMTRSPIIGLHAFRSSARWSLDHDPLFPDPPPSIEGKRQYFLRRGPSPVATHCEDPSPRQAFRYGIHRGLKAFPNRPSPGRLHHAWSHWRLLKRVWKHFNDVEDRRLGLALAGVEAALDGLIGSADVSYSSPSFINALNDWSDLDAPTLLERLSTTWDRRVDREGRWYRQLLKARVDEDAAAPSDRKVA